MTGLQDSEDNRSAAETEDPFLGRGTREAEAYARKRGFANYREYRKFVLANKGFASQTEYRNALATKKGLKDGYEYIKALDKRRQRNPEYAQLATTIRARMKELRLNQNQLATLSGIDRRQIAGYIRGKHYPKPAKLRAILRALEIRDYTPIVGTDFYKRSEPGRQLLRPRNEKYRLLASHISKELERHGHTVGWLAKQTGIPVEHVSLYKRGIVFPRPGRLKAILSVLASLDAGAP
jgi:transcriptional regulator with XRE-family HTH domain